jgi:hypothetical protein
MPKLDDITPADAKPVPFPKVGFHQESEFRVFGGAEDVSAGGGQNGYHDAHSLWQ